MSHRTIAVDGDVFATLQSLAEPLVDDANAVLRRLLHLPASQPDTGPTEQYALEVESNVARAARGAGGSPVKRSSSQRSGRPISQKRKRGSATRAPAGSLLPEAQYELPLLEALIELGGSAPTSDVVDRLGKTLDDKLKEGDRETLSSGEVRWKNRVQFVRLGLIKGGHMTKDSPRGVWEITDVGRQRVAAEAGA